MLNKQILEETIRMKELKQDKYKRNYLVLELENREKILVFQGKVKSTLWPKLAEGKKYEFTYEESPTGGKLLLDFVEIDSDIFIN